MFSNWTVTAIAIAYSLFITPIVIRALETEMYGVWSFLNGLVGYSDLLYLGLGSALTRQVAAHTVKNDHQAINRVVSVVMSIFCVLGLLCFASMLALSPWVGRLFAHPLSGDAARAATLTCILLGIQLLFFFVASGFAGILVGYDRFDLMNAARLIVLIVRFALISFVIRGGTPLLRLALFMTASTGLEVLILALIAHRISPQLRIRSSAPRIEELRLLYGFGLQSFLIVFVVKLISYTDTTVIGVVLGAASVTFYALPLQLIDYSRIALSGFSGVFLPRLTVLHATGDLHGLQEAYMRGTRIGASIAAFLLTNIVILGAPFLTLWVGPDFGQPVRWIILLLAGATLLHVFITIVPLPFYQAMHLLAFPAKVLLAEALANLLLSVILARRLGINGVALATFIPTLCISFPVLPRYLCRKLSLSVWSVLRTSLGSAILLGSAVASAHWLMNGVIPQKSYAALALRVILTVPVAAAAAFCSLSVRDRKELLGRGVK